MLYYSSCKSFRCSSRYALSTPKVQINWEYVYTIPLSGLQIRVAQMEWFRFSFVLLEMWKHHCINSMNFAMSGRSFEYDAFYKVDRRTDTHNTGLNYFTSKGVYHLYKFLLVSFFSIVPLFCVANSISNFLFKQKEKMRHYVPLTSCLVAFLKDMFLSNLICCCFCCRSQINSSFLTGKS